LLASPAVNDSAPPAMCLVPNVRPGAGGYRVLVQVRCVRKAWKSGQPAHLILGIRVARRASSLRRASVPVRSSVNAAFENQGQSALLSTWDDGPLRVQQSALW